MVLVNKLPWISKTLKERTTRNALAALELSHKKIGDSNHRIWLLRHLERSQNWICQKHMKIFDSWVKNPRKFKSKGRFMPTDPLFIKNERRKYCWHRSVRLWPYSLLFTMEHTMAVDMNNIRNVQSIGQVVMKAREDKSRLSKKHFMYSTRQIGNRHLVE